MNEGREGESSDREANFSRQVGRQAARKLKARRGPSRSVWAGLGVSGLVGWSVTIPTLLGAMIGIWLDSRYPSKYSWTIMFLVVGLLLGCLNAWHWVELEYEDIREDSHE
ncbi:AtpZ/AtpI family protein [Tundrisphaera lichenicola]|uniref:AtpZ/AtpI family protein n=1 Tax=Tundrisphaera lichenicola TaxID=2029860 RepID=UPI003EB8B565